MTRDILAERRKSLEESFFRRRNIELMQRLRQQLELEAKRTELAMVSGIQDEKLLDRLISLEMTSATVAALALVPMVRIAWADGSLEAKEQDAILQAAVEGGLSKDSAGYHWLSSWLEHEPDDELKRAWREYVAALKETLPDDDREALKHGLINRAQQVAEAAGGFLGLGGKVSTEEQGILDELRSAFG